MTSRWLKTMVSFHPLRIGLFPFANGRTPWLITTGMKPPCVFIWHKIGVFGSRFQVSAKAETRSPEIARARKIWSLRDVHDVHETLLIVHCRLDFRCQTTRKRAHGVAGRMSEHWPVGAVGLQATSMRRGLWLAMEPGYGKAEHPLQSLRVNPTTTALPMN